MSWLTYLSSWQWRGPQGQQPMIPKDEGYSIMVSAFQSRELGFGMNLSDDDLKTVNQWKKDRPDYTDTESAIKLNGKTEK